MRIVRVIGPQGKGVRVDRIVVDGTQLIGGIVTATCKGTQFEVTTIVARPKSARGILKLFKENPKLIRAGVDVEWLQSVQPKLENALVATYKGKTS